MMHILRQVVFLFVGTLSLAANAVTYYVSPSGSNANAGTSIGAPKQTIGAATSIANPGDIIEVRAGTYTENLVISRPGSSTAWITLRGYQGDAMPVIRRTGAGSTIYFYTQACEDAVTAGLSGNTDCQPMYWVVQGLEVRGSATGGGDGNAVKIDTPKVKLIGNKLCCAVADVVKVVRTANDVEIIDNEIWQSSAITTPSDNAQGIDIVGADRTIIRGNYVHDVPDIGMYAKGNARNTLMENNLLVNIGGTANGHAMMLGQETDADLLLDGNYEVYDGVIRNNVVIGSTWACIAISSASNVTAAYNSCYNTGSVMHGSIFLSAESIIGQLSSDVTISNNIIVGNPSQPLIKIVDGSFTNFASLTITNNIYWTTTGAAATYIPNDSASAVNFTSWKTNYTTLTGKTDSSRQTDPLFARTAAGWNSLALKGDSPAIDTGTAVSGVTNDFRFAPRGASPDIGAREFVGTRITDVTGPALTTTLPTNGATNVATTTGITVNFTEDIDCGTVNSSSIAVSGASGTVSCAARSIGFSPTAQYPTSTTLTVTVASTVKDLAGNNITGNRTFSFTTVASQGAGADFTFLAYGDSRAGNLCSANAVHIGLVNRMVAEANTSMVFHLGDMVTGYNNYTNWVNDGACTNPSERGSFKQMIAPLQNKTPAAGLPTFFFPVIGNHDDDWGGGWYPGPTGFNYGHGFCDVFTPTTIGMTNHTTKSYWQDKTGRVPLYTDPEFFTSMCSLSARAAYPDLGYYKVSYKTTRFLIMRVNNDNYDLMECGTCSGTLNNYDHYYYKHQLDWLRYELDLAQGDAAVDNIVVLLHAPVLTSSWGHSANGSAYILLTEFSQRSKVKLVLQGHNHVYERSYPTLANNGTPLGFRSDTNGVYYVTTGGGGSPVHGFNSLGPLTEIGNTNYHYMKCSVTSTGVSCSAIKDDGSTFDTFTTKTR